MCGTDRDRPATFAAPDRMTHLLHFLRRHLLLVLAISLAVTAWANAEPRTGCAPRQPYHHPLGRILAHGVHADSSLVMRRGSAQPDTCAAEVVVSE